MCWDDNLLAVGTEVGSIELFSVKKILQRAEQAHKNQVAGASQDVVLSGYSGSDANKQKSEGEARQ